MLCMGVHNQDATRKFRQTLNPRNWGWQGCTPEPSTERGYHFPYHEDAVGLSCEPSGNPLIGGLVSGLHIEKRADGTSRVRFKTVAARQTPAQMRSLVGLWRDSTRELRTPYMVLLAAFNLDFLCVHPFRDGNGRVSRLLMLLQAYHGNLEVGRYISLERLVEENKERYYETLEQSSERWHAGTHDPWPYIQFVLYLFKLAYKEFEERLGRIGAPRGEKRSHVEEFIQKSGESFSVREVQDGCPGVSIDMVRKVLKDLQKESRVECLGKGRAARWRRVGAN